ncbi:hypothetical protein O7623_27815 [Solwaraspora sp. WMMD791]|uniref:hypothetical protein n=1 Tax=Solwaraspora sp. WMMD791 TaxID=3016086 RepID=UPI00249CA84D|nr:hypothetical protein [Solwaraspora sp. WMMD791]WFE27020.1 hypothetical protein O7623_27815 [Solwaraspora sp. WMMD791]
MQPAHEAVRRRRRLDGPLLRSAVTVLVLVPVCVLFVQLWRGTSADVAFAQREREGVAYLAALNELTVALVDAQSAAVARQPVNAEALTRALAAVAEVDQRIGASLRAQQRWTSLRAAVEALPDRRFDEPTAAFDAYRETTDLLLAHYDRIRESSNLVRDPEGDAYHLSDGAAEELPEALIATGRFADLAVLLPTRPAQERPLALVELIGATSDILSPADDLASNVQAAVESTDSRTMSSNLLTQVDRFQRSMDAIAAAAAVLNTAAAELTRAAQSDDDSSDGTGTSTGGDGDGDGDSGDDDRESGAAAVPDLGQLVALRGEAQASAAELAGTMLVELDGLLADRISGSQRDQWLSVGVLILAVGLVSVPVLITYGTAAGPRTPPAGTGPTDGPPATGGRTGPADDADRVTSDSRQWEPTVAAR